MGVGWGELSGGDLLCGCDFDLVLFVCCVGFVGCY